MTKHVLLAAIDADTETIHFTDERIIKDLRSAALFPLMTIQDDTTHVFELIMQKPNGTWARGQGGTKARAWETTATVKPIGYAVHQEGEE